MKKNRIAVIPGDGIGMEVAQVGVKVLTALSEKRNLGLTFKWFDLGADRYLKTGETLPQPIFEELSSEFDAIYFGAVGDPRVPDMKHAKDILLGLRMRLDLFINLRPIQLYHEKLTPLKNKSVKDIDMVIFRENTEDLYVGIGGNFKMNTPDEIAINEMISSRKGVERIIRAAFDWAISHGKSKVCMSDKANAISFAHGLWQRTFKDVSKDYPQIQTRHVYADALAMELVRAPEDFEVIVTSNLLGDILSDLGAQLVGGLGLAASANLHPGKVSLFEPIHGSAPNLAGKDLANPFAMILTGALMLDALGYAQEALLIENLVKDCIEANIGTVDLGGQLGTQAVGDYLVGRIQA
jgi:3-isopropylmalate dehydrogenase